MKREPEDDTLLRSYLLGELRVEEADGLERRLLAEDELFELAEAVEADLLAAADRGELAPAERERVLRRLASSPQGRERLELARSLNAEAAARAVVLPFANRARAVPPRAVRWLSLAASLLLVSTLSWFAWEHRAQAPSARSQVAVQTPTPTPIPVPRGISAPPVVLALSLMSSRGAGEDLDKLYLPPGTREAQIQVDTEGLDDSPAFHAVLRRNQATVWEKGGIVPTALSWGRGLVLAVPADRLTPGRYEVAVTAQRGGDEVSKEFEVVAAKP
jgi:hypothetical protein